MKNIATLEFTIAIDTNQKNAMLDSIKNASDTAEIAIKHDQRNAELLAQKLNDNQIARSSAIAAQNRRANAARLEALLK